MRALGGLPALALAALAISCSSKSDGKKDGARWVVPGAISVHWESRFEGADTLLTAPAKLASTSKIVAVLDMGARRVVGFDRLTGRHAWTYAKNGSGPTEIKDPSDIGVDPDGAIYVIDGANGKVVWLDDVGHFVRESSNTELASVRSSCVMQDRRMLVFQLSMGRPIVLLAADGRRIDASNVPWSAEAPMSAPMGPDAGALFTDLIRTNQGVFGGDGRQLCAYAGQTSNGLALYAQGILRWVRSTQVKVPDESLRAASISSISVGVRGNQVLVATIGTGENRGRYIDAYAASDGTYLKSWKAPTRMSWVSFDSAGLVALRLTSSGAVISSWRLHDSSR